MGLPPSEAGAVQVSVAWALPAVAVPTVGAPGTLIGAGAGAGAVPDEIAQMWPESGTRPALGSSPAYTVPSGSTASPLTELKPDAYTPGFAVDSGTARSRRQTLVASPAYSVLLPSETSDNGAASPSAAVGRADAPRPLPGRFRRARRRCWWSHRTKAGWPPWRRRCSWSGRPRPRGRSRQWRRRPKGGREFQAGLAATRPQLAQLQAQRRA